MESGTGFLMDEPTWAQRVKTVRLRLNITQTELAEKLDSHINTIAQWEIRSERPYSAEADRFMAIESELELAVGEPS